MLSIRKEKTLHDPEGYVIVLLYYYIVLRNT